MRHICAFNEVPKNTTFYTRRYQDGVDADSICLFKGEDPNVCEFQYNEWQPTYIPNDTRCWYYN